MAQNNDFLNSKIRQLQTESRYFSILHSFSSALISAKTASEIVWSVARNAISKLDLKDCVIYLLDDDREYLFQAAAHGPKNPIDFDILNPIKIKVGEGIVGTVAKTGEPLLINDTSVDARYIVDDSIRLSELAVPIKTDDHVYGVIDSEHPERNFYNENHLSILTTIAHLTAIKLKEAKSNDQIIQYKEQLEELVTERTFQIETTLEYLEEKNQQLQQFNAIVGHDFQSSMSTLSGFVTILTTKEEHLSVEEKSEILNHISSISSNLTKLVKDAYRYSNTGIHSSEMEYVDVVQILKNIKAELYPVIKKQNVVIEFSNLPEIYGQASLIKLVFQNLISNSIKYRSEKDPVIKIYSTKKTEDDHIFAVEDNGIGIDSSDHKKVFQKLFRSKNKGDVKGSGIGLSIVLKILHNFGGDISIDSSFTSGTRFLLNFPIHK